MGVSFEFNWVLKLPNLDEDSLSIGTTYSFSKKGARIYPLEAPIELINENWEPVGRCVITHIDVSPTTTVGDYVLIEKYDTDKKEFLSHHYRTYKERILK